MPADAPKTAICRRESDCTASDSRSRPGLRPDVYDYPVRGHALLTRITLADRPIQRLRHRQLAARALICVNGAAGPCAGVRDGSRQRRLHSIARRLALPQLQLRIFLPQTSAGPSGSHSILWGTVSLASSMLRQPAEVVRFLYENGDLTGVAAPGNHRRQLSERRKPLDAEIVFSADGKSMFVSVGSSSNVADSMPPLLDSDLAAFRSNHALGAAWGPEEDRADVLAFDPDGKNRRVFAAGIRNCSGLTVRPEDSALWSVVNERDILGDDLPPDYAIRRPREASTAGHGITSERTRTRAERMARPTSPVQA